MDSSTTSTIAPNIPNKSTNNNDTVRSSNVNQSQNDQKTHQTAESYVLEIQNDKNDLETQLADHQKEKENYENSYGVKILLENKLSASFLENNELDNKLLQLNDTLKRINQNKDQTLVEYSEINKKYTKSLETSFNDHQVNLEKNLIILELKIKDIINENNNTKVEMKNIIENLQSVICSKNQQYSNISLELEKKIEENNKIIQESIALKKKQAEKLKAIENDYQLNLKNKQQEVNILKEIIFGDLSESADLLKTMTAIMKFNEDNVPDDLLEKRQKLFKCFYSENQAVVVNYLRKRFDNIALASNSQFPNRYFCNKKISYYDSTICAFARENLSSYEIDLSQRNLVVLPNDIFTGFNNLTKLNLSFNRLNYLESGTFNNLLNLKILDMRNSHLSSLPKDIFTGLKNLESLDLSSNDLDCLESGTFNNLSNLQTLNIRSNYLTELSSDLFNGLEKLESLILSLNRLDSLQPKTFNTLSSLQSLDLYDNNLTELPRDIFDGLEKLERLDISQNELYSLQPGTFYDLSNLWELLMERNNLRSLSENIFTGLKNLGKLNLLYNPLNYLDPEIFENLPKLFGLRILEQHLTTDTIYMLKNIYYPKDHQLLIKFY